MTDNGKTLTQTSPVKLPHKARSHYMTVTQYGDTNPSKFAGGNAPSALWSTSITHQAVICFLSGAQVALAEETASFDNFRERRDEARRLAQVRLLLAGMRTLVQGSQFSAPVQVSHGDPQGCSHCSDVSQVLCGQVLTPLGRMHRTLC